MLGCSGFNGLIFLAGLFKTYTEWFKFVALSWWLHYVFIGQQKLLQVESVNDNDCRLTFKVCFGNLLNSANKVLCDIISNTQCFTDLTLLRINTAGLIRTE